MSKKKSTHVSGKKKRAVVEITNLIKSKKTILIASIKNLPASQFQEICKKLRGKAIVKVPKKNLMIRAIEGAENEDIKKIEKYINEGIAILFSDLDSFELAAELSNNKSPTKAKPGQESPDDIEIPAGPTDLVPGPAISELGSLGIQVQVQDGKIHIRQSKIIAKKGEKISQKAADLMSKLDIKPCSVGFVPLASFDSKENKFYAEISIDKEGTIASLQEACSKAIAFAVEIGYYCKGTISFLIGKAGMHAKTLENFVGKEKEEVKEKNAQIPEEKNENTGGKK